MVGLRARAAQSCFGGIPAPQALQTAPELTKEFIGATQGCPEHPSAPHSSQTFPGALRSSAQSSPEFPGAPQSSRDVFSRSPELSFCIFIMTFLICLTVSDRFADAIDQLDCYVFINVQGD